MEKNNLHNVADMIKENLGADITVIEKYFNIGAAETLNTLLIYINGLVEKNLIDSDVIKPLMHWVHEDLSDKENLDEYLLRNCISLSAVYIEKDINRVIFAVRRGKTLLYTEYSKGYIILDTTGGNYRAVTEPLNETSIRGPRDAFVENLESNVSNIRRRIRDKNMQIEMFTVGRRSQTDVAMVYIKDIADDNLIKMVRDHIQKVDVDRVTASGVLQQYIERYSFSVFPQMLGTERPDKAAAYLMDGKAVVIVDGTPTVIVAPSSFIDFFQAVEDYYERTIITNFVRLLRIIAVFLVITSSSIYLSLLKFNVELIPVKFISPIIQSRTGIALTPFMEILSMEIIVEFLREGGLRLPTKIGQTLSVVGGIIIGDTAIRSKIVSPTTLLIVGATVIATFLIPNYDMSLTIRFLRFPMLILANFLGIFGIGIGWFFIIVHLCSIDSFGVPYFTLKLKDMKDIFIRAPLYDMKTRPEMVPHKDNVRQTAYRKKFRRKEAK